MQFFALVSLLVAVAAATPLSAPVARDSNPECDYNKYPKVGCPAPQTCKVSRAFCMRAEYNTY